MMEQFHDPHFWVLLATIVFVAVAYKKGRAPLLKLLDDRTRRIGAELEEARNLRAQAQELLNDAQRKHRDAIQTSQTILDNAKEGAALLAKEAEQKLAENMARRETQLLSRITRAEQAAVQELRTQAADLASRAAEKLLQENPQKFGGKLVEDAINDLSGILN